MERAEKAIKQRLARVRFQRVTQTFLIMIAKFKNSITMTKQYEQTWNLSQYLNTKLILSSKMFENHIISFAFKGYSRILSSVRRRKNRGGEVILLIRRICGARKG